MATSLRTIRRLQKRADTIHRKVEALMSEIMDAYGDNGRVGGPRSEIMSDLSDNLLHSSEEMTDGLHRAALYSTPDALKGDAR